MDNLNIKNGQVIMVDFGKNVGSVQSGIRPAVIIQNDVGNKFAPTTIVLPLTKTSNGKKNIPTHYELTKDRYTFLSYNSTVLGEQVLTISKEQILKVLGKIDADDINNIYQKILVSIGASNLNLSLD